VRKILKFFINELNNQFLLRRDKTIIIADSQQFLECNLDCPTSWTGFVITAIFKKDGVPSTVIDVVRNVPFKVPALPLAGEGVMLVSFEAVKNGVNIVITNEVPINILPSGVDGIEPLIPTLENPNPYAQYVAIMEAIKTTTNEYKETSILKATEASGSAINAKISEDNAKDWEHGATINRPSPTRATRYFDDTLGKPIWFHAVLGHWVDATGAVV